MTTNADFGTKKKNDMNEIATLATLAALFALIVKKNNKKYQQNCKIMKEEKTYIENGYAYVLQKQRNDGYLYDSGVCLSKSLAYEMRENKECDYVEEVPIFGSEQDKELLDKLKNPPQFEPFNSDLFTEKIAETANKTAKATHEFNMKEIKAKLIADLCVKIVETSEYEEPESVAQIAREIADKALENL